MAGNLPGRTPCSRGAPLRCASGVAASRAAVPAAAAAARAPRSAAVARVAAAAAGAPTCAPVATAGPCMQQRACRPAARRPRLAAVAAAPAAAAESSALEAAAALKAWYTGAARDLPADLTPRPVEGPHGGFCMITEGPVAQGAPLLAVPRELLMSAETARASPVCGALVERADLDDWQALILHLLCECADPASAWAPYLAVLRRADTAQHPLLWDGARLAWLAGSPMERLLQARREQVEADTAALVAAGANDLALPGGGGGGGPLVTVERVAWAAAVLLSRAFSLYLASEADHELMPMEDFGSWSLDRGGSDVLALVPWADLLQHSSDAGAASVLTYDVETSTAFLCAHRDYSAGEEVHDSYGPGLSPSDLLCDYGFVDPGNQNYRYDAVPASVAPPRGPRNAALLAAIDRLQGAGALLALGASGPDTTGRTYLRAALAGDAELVRAGWRVRAGPNDVGLAARVLGRLSRPDSAATEAAVLRALGDHCAAALVAYPSTLEEDEAEAAALAAACSSGGGGGGGEGYLRLQALRALASEKRALAGTAAAVAGWRARLEAGCAPAELYIGEDDSSDDDWQE